MFSSEERQAVLDLYFSLEPRLSPERFVEELGCPSRRRLSDWLKEDPRYDRDVGSYKSASLEKKLEAIRMYESGASGQTVAKALGLGNKTSVYLWCRAYAENGVLGLLPESRISAMVEEKHEKPKGEAPDAPSPRPKPAPAPPQAVCEDDGPLPDDPDALKKMVGDLRLRLAISEEVVGVLKADPRAKAGGLTNKEKTAVASRLEGRFPLRELLAALSLKRSTYYYDLEALTRPDKHAALKGRIACVFEASGRTWGSERIWATLRHGLDGLPAQRVSEKVVRRLMAETGCAVVYAKKPRRSYSSYKGEVSKAPANVVKRDFHAERPNELWLTDITEFKLPDAPKVYLSAVVDCFDGKPIAWRIGLHPTKRLANETLEAACSQKAEGDRPVIHSDRGGHYRWPDWIAICEANSLVRSMSALGSSPDNAAMEGFFGSLKNEFFHYRDWSDVEAGEFMDRLDEQLCYHCEDRIKKSLGWQSPNQYRRSLNHAA